MIRHATSLTPEYFSERYALNPDPWDFETSRYEREKYDATLAALPKPRYASALEVGCSIGVLTREIAARCDRMHCLDIAPLALDQARARCADLSHVAFSETRVPGEWPDGRFDLILLSEVVYYLDAGDVARLAGRVRDALVPGGDVALVHWTGETHYPLPGDEAAALFIRHTADFLGVVRQERADAYRLDVLSRTAG